MRVTCRGDALSLCVIVVTILLNCCFVLSESSSNSNYSSTDLNLNSSQNSRSSAADLLIIPKTATAADAQNYISTSILADGETEVRMRFGDIIVKETSISAEDSRGERSGLVLRQVASGQILLQMIYKINSHHELNNNNSNSFSPSLAKSNNNNHRNKKHKKFKLLECEVINDWNSADQFRSNFKRELRENGLLFPVPNNYFNSSYSHNDDLMDYYEDQDDESDSIDLNVQQSKVTFQNMTARILRNEEIVGDLQDSFDITIQQRLCKRLHRKMKREIHAQKLLKQHITSEVSSHGIRKKREIGDAFRIPGTRWCGVASSAKEFKQMGGFTGADKCCRFHDLGCPFFIPGMTENYGLFNWRFMTLNHCTCDERFRVCLKATNTGAANFVGKLFFNVVQTKCFVLKTEKVCTSRSWWGKCLHYEYKKQAHIRDPVTY